MSEGPTMSPDKALQLLKEGNKRFVEGTMTYNNHVDNARREGLTGGQSPYATVLGCSDSRVSVEHIFDAGLGDIFVCRNAGNILEEVTLGSIEYAVAHTGCPLAVVMGHKYCGAMTATVTVARNPDAYESPYVDHICRRLLPAALSIKRYEVNSIAEWVQAATIKNVENIVMQATRQSEILKSKMQNGEFKIVGAFYDLNTGEVNFFS